MNCKCGWPLIAPIKTVKKGLFKIKEIPAIQDYICPKCGRQCKIQGYKDETKILNEYTTRIFHRKPKKERPIPKAQKGDTTYTIKFESPQGKPPGDPPKQPKVTVNEYGTREPHCEPPKGSKPKPPHNQYGDNRSGSIDNSELDILLPQTINAESFIETMNSQRKFKEKLEKDTLQYSIVTKDEYILNFNKRFGSDKESATESFNKISEGYNFIFELEPYHFYSVDYINKLLER